MKQIIGILIVAFCLGCHSKGEMSMGKINWKQGTFEEFEKVPIQMFLTNSEPNLIFSDVVYEQDYSEGCKQIAALIKTAEDKGDDPDIPFFAQPEQLWVVFDDNTGSVFPFTIGGGACVIRGKEGFRGSEQLDNLMEYLRVCQIYREPKPKIAFGQIHWQKGRFADLKKGVVGLIVSNYEPNLNFAKAEEKDDLSEEAARIIYFFANNNYYENLSNWSAWNQLMWVAFEDGTGSVFECYDLVFNATYIRSDNSARESETAQDIINLVRRRERIRQNIREGKIEPCPTK